MIHCLHWGLHVLDCLVHLLSRHHLHGLAHWLLHILGLAVESVHCALLVEGAVHLLLLSGALLVWIGLGHLFEYWICFFMRCGAKSILRLLVHHVESLGLDVLHIFFELVCCWSLDRSRLQLSLVQLRKGTFILLFLHYHHCCNISWLDFELQVMRRYILGEAGVQLAGKSLHNHPFG